jgi:predicted transcriptional regulator
MKGTPMAEEPNMLGLTAEIVAAHVAKNAVAPADLPRLIQDVYRTLAAVGQQPEPRRPERPQPAVPIKRSSRGRSRRATWSAWRTAGS